MAINPVPALAVGAPVRRPDSQPVGAAPGPAAPDGVSLWEILTPEEREFFAQQAAMGPVSYRPGGQPAPAAAPTGQRLDVRA